MHPTPRIAVSASLIGRVPPSALRQLARRIRRAARRMGISAQQLAGVGLRLVDDIEMADLHLRFMNESGPTDVLSFEADPIDADADLDDGSLGDIAVDWQAVERQARVRTMAGLIDEATILVVHGLAHLLGHDHRTRSEFRRMHRLERVGLRAVGVPDPARPVPNGGRR